MTGPSLNRLLQTWQAWSYRDLLTRAIGTADAAGDADRADQLRRGLALEPDVAPLDALAANHELVRLLSGWQWHAVRAAREAGATWAEIGRAAGTTADEARADFLDKIERSERHGHGFTDTTPYRAVLDDPPSVADQPATTNRSLAPGRSAASHPPAVRGHGGRR